MSLEPLMLTPTQAAKRLGIGRTWMFELIKRGREGREDGIPSVLLGRRKRLIPESALRDYARRLADGQIV